MKKIIFLLIIIVIILFCCIGTFWYLKNKNKYEKPYSEITYTDFIYKVKFQLGADYFIYLLPDEEIKVVSKVQEFKSKENCDCMDPTGNYIYEEYTIDFSDNAKKKAIKVLDGLYKKSGKKEYDSYDLELSDLELRTLISIVFKDEEELTIDDMISYRKETKSFGDDKIINTKMVIDKTSNEILNKISDYLDDIINISFDSDNDYSKKMIDGGLIDNVLGVNYSIELTNVGPYSISFIIRTEGRLEDTTMYDIAGYNFNYNGEIKEFDAEGWKEDYYNKALNTFVESDLYKESNSELVANWKAILKDNMFLLGNWYFDDKDNIVFTIDGQLMGFSLVTAKEVSISVPVDEKF